MVWHPARFRVIAFHLGVLPNGEEITMLVFERLLAVADEGTLDLARAMIGKPELAMLLAKEALKNTTEVLSPTTVAIVLNMTSRDALDKTEELRHLRTTGAERLNLMRFAREVEASHKESPRLNEYH